MLPKLSPFMKILQIANKVPYPPRDGGSIATFAMTKGFRELGHEVTVLAMSTSKHPVMVSDIPQEIREKIRFLLVDVNTQLDPWRATRNLFFSRLPYNAERFVSRDFSQRLQYLLSEEVFDVIQLEGLYLAPYVPRIRKYSKALLSMRSHNIEHEIWERSVKQRTGLTKFYTGIIAKRVRKMEVASMNRYDAMIPITRRDGDILISMGCKLSMHISPTGINILVRRSENKV